MRISGSLVGIFVILMIIIASIFCSILTYNATRQIVIDSQESGLLLDNPAQLIDAVINPGSLKANASTTPIPPVGSNVQVQSLITPQATAALFETALPIASEESPLEVTQATQPEITEIALSPEDQSLETIGRWEDPRQIRILLMGIDQRKETGDEGPFRTDTMMVINVDPIRKTAGLISFPRDMWVTIPNFQPNKINTANFLGDANAYPGGGGPKLAMETIAANFGIPVTRYIPINFDVFLTLVDTLAPDGVEICIDQTIDDPDYPDNYYGTISVHFDPGCQRLNAEQLLQYARTRATSGGDFERAARQQEVLNALLREFLSAGGVTNFITSAPQLWTELNDSYQTNLTYEEILQLAVLMMGIQPENINMAVIDSNYVNLGTSPDGLQVLLPIQSRITDLIQRTFYAQTDIPLAEWRSRADSESAAIYVYNGTDDIAGLASNVREWLAGKGVTVANIGNDTNHGGSKTVIRDYGNHPATARYLAELLGLGPNAIEPGTDGLIAEGVAIVAGPDIVPILSDQ
ncbi:hypothetical protein MASR2M15_09880 [Anaerolineales bacterium]